MAVLWVDWWWFYGWIGGGFMGGLVVVLWMDWWWFYGWVILRMGEDFMSGQEFYG